MAALFGVSRTPIREAMQSLSLLGVVNVSPRRGATVQALPVESVVDLAILSGTMAPERSVDDVLAFRLAMESAIAELAATNARDEDLAHLRSILADNRAAVEGDDRDAANEADIRFHAAIAEASGNLVFTSVAHVLNGLLVELRKTTGGIPGASDASLAEHQAIMAALDRRDGEAARHAASEHIANTGARYHARQAELAARCRVRAIRRTRVTNGERHHPPSPGLRCWATARSPSSTPRRWPRRAPGSASWRDPTSRAPPPSRRVTG